MAQGNDPIAGKNKRPILPIRSSSSGQTRKIGPMCKPRVLRHLFNKQHSSLSVMGMIPMESKAPISMLLEIYTHHQKQTNKPNQPTIQNIPGKGYRNKLYNMRQSCKGLKDKVACLQLPALQKLNLQAGLEFYCGNGCNIPCQTVKGPNQAIYTQQVMTDERKKPYYDPNKQLVMQKRT